MGLVFYVVQRRGGKRLHRFQGCFRGIFQQSVFSLEQLLSGAGRKRRQYCPVVDPSQVAHKIRYVLHVQGARHKPQTTKKRAPASSSVGGGSRLCAKFSLAPSNHRASVMAPPRCPPALSAVADTACPAAAAGGEYDFPLPRSSHFIPQKSDTVCQNSPTSETDHRWRSGQLRVQCMRSGDSKGGGEGVFLAIQLLLVLL